jgi:hypothetical protein
MGFEHFIILDNQSDDNLQSILLKEEDVSLFFVKGSYKNARFGMDWINGLLSKYCSSKWILHVDIDEFLVFPHCDQNGIADLTAVMTKKRQFSLQCLMVDMYSSRKVNDNICGVGENPLSVCSFFDRDGYDRHYDPCTETVWIKGGVRGRIYFANDTSKGPALNKTPLVFWQKHFAYLKSAHELWPPRLNGGQSTQGKMRGALLHFKFLSDFTTKVTAEAIRRQHTEEYNAYFENGSIRNDSPNFIGPPSVQYTGWHSLQEAGLIDGTVWPLGPSGQLDRASEHRCSGNGG